jgi:hypothetical protein
MLLYRFSSCSQKILECIAVRCCTVHSIFATQYSCLKTRDVRNAFSLESKPFEVAHHQRRLLDLIRTEAHLVQLIGRRIAVAVRTDASVLHRLARAAPWDGGRQPERGFLSRDKFG